MGGEEEEERIGKKRDTLCESWEVRRTWHGAGIVRVLTTVLYVEGVWCSEGRKKD